MLELKIPPVVVVFVTGTLMWWMAWLMPAFRFAIPGRVPIATICAAAGFLVAVWGVVQFGRAGTTVNPMKPESSSRLVVSGMYAFTRNPMYLGALIVLLAWAVYVSHVVAFLFLPLYVLYMNRFQIQPEERTLTQLFGQEFTAYASRVRRWI
ncbi:membrane protein [Nitrospira sp.]|nr:membrane protein [Nitrospira sp.]